MAYTRNKYIKLQCWEYTRLSTVFRVQCMSTYLLSHENYNTTTVHIDTNCRLTDTITSA